MLLNLFRISRIASLSLASAIMFASCAGADAPSLSDVKGFDAYRVYYPGGKAAGLPLDGIEGEKWQGDQRLIRWSFYYGQCNPPPTGESGCAPPLQVHNYSICRRWPTMSDSKPRLFNFRGAKATGSGEIEDPLEVFTGRTTVVISAKQRIVATVAARKLHNVRQARPQSNLPPPVRGSLGGQLPCQNKQG